MPTIDERKLAVREAVWSALESAGVVAGPVHGKIPDFHGAGNAAAKLAEFEAWASARVVKVMPDRAQQAVRERALYDGKIVYMATPKLATEKPFVVLDPSVLGDKVNLIGSGVAAVSLGRPAEVSEFEPVDLIVCGTVAVTLDGRRLGKGAGYADIEVALLTAAGLLGPSTLIATTVHDLQVVDQAIPEEPHDFGVDLIVTPTRVIHTNRRRRPTGIDWSDIPAAKIASIPTLARQAGLCVREQPPSDGPVTK